MPNYFFAVIKNMSHKKPKNELLKFDKLGGESKTAKQIRMEDRQLAEAIVIENSPIKKETWKGLKRVYQIFCEKFELRERIIAAALLILVAVAYVSLSVFVPFFEYKDAQEQLRLGNYFKARATAETGLFFANLQPLATPKVRLMQVIGNVDCKAGEVDQAGSLYRRAGELISQETSFMFALGLPVESLCDNIFRDKKWFVFNSKSQSADIQNDQAEILFYKGDFDGAEKATRSVIESNSDAYGRDDSSVGDGVANLTMILIAKDELPDAESTALRSLEIRKKCWGVLSSPVASSLELLGSVYDASNRPDLAVHSYVDARNIYAQLFSPNHPELVLVDKLIAQSQLNFGNYSAAKSILENLLPHVKSIFGSKSLQTQQTLELLAEAYQRDGNLKDAQKCLNESLSIKITVFPLDFFPRARTLQSTGLLLARQGRFMEAEEALSEAEALIRKFVKPESPRYADVIIAKGDMFRLWEKWSEAERCYKQALDTDKPVVRKNDKRLYVIYDGLETVLRKQKKLTEANLVAKDKARFLADADSQIKKSEIAK